MNIIEKCIEQYINRKIYRNTQLWIDLIITQIVNKIGEMNLEKTKHNDLIDSICDICTDALRSILKNEENN